MRGLIVFALLLPALGSAQPFDPTPSLVDTSLVPLPIYMAQTTPRAAFDGANCLVVWNGPWHGSQDSIVATRLSPTGLLLDLRAHGRSAGDTTSFGVREAWDVQAAHAYLRGLPEIPFLSS